MLEHCKRRAAVAVFVADARGKVQPTDAQRWLNDGSASEVGVRLVQHSHPRARHGKELRERHEVALVVPLHFFDGAVEREHGVVVVLVLVFRWPLAVSTQDADDEAGALHRRVAVQIANVGNDVIRDRRQRCFRKHDDRCAEGRRSESPIDVARLLFVFLLPLLVLGNCALDDGHANGLARRLGPLHSLKRSAGSPRQHDE